MTTSLHRPVLNLVGGEWQSRPRTAGGAQPRRHPRAGGHGAEHGRRGRARRVRGRRARPRRPGAARARWTADVSCSAPPSCSATVSDELSRTLTLEMGKTLAEASGEVGKAADFFEYYGGLGRAERGSLLSHENPDVMSWTVHEPLGVVLAITPWNDPLLTPARKLAPALDRRQHRGPQAGLRHARDRDRAGAGAARRGTAARRAEHRHRRGPPDRRSPPRPPGAEGGELHGFERRRRLAEGISRRSRRPPAGGARWQERRRRPRRRRPRAGGGEHRGRGLRAGRAALHGDQPGARAARASSTPYATAWCGPPRLTSSAPASTPTSPWVPSCRRPSATRSQGFVERALANGATRATSPEPALPSEHGCYVAPTVLTDVDPAMEIWTDEVFGPVVALVAFDTLDEALDLVNASQFGLAAAIYTSDLSAAHAFAERADVGQVAVNLPTSGWDVHMPFGGFKTSGSGHKEQGLEGLDFYRRTKTVALHERRLTDADDRAPEPGLSALGHHHHPVDGQRHVRTRQQRPVLLVLRHRGDRAGSFATAAWTRGTVRSSGSVSSRSARTPHRSASRARSLPDCASVTSDASSVRYEVVLYAAGAGEPAASGHFVHVYVDRESRRPTAIPDASAGEALSALDATNGQRHQVGSSVAAGPDLTCAAQRCRWAPARWGRSTRRPPRWSPRSSRRSAPCRPWRRRCRRAGRRRLRSLTW